jgi:hypothetical protein
MEAIYRALKPGLVNIRESRAAGHLSQHFARQTSRLVAQIYTRRHCFEHPLLVMHRIILARGTQRTIACFLWRPYGVKLRNRPFSGGNTSQAALPMRSKYHISNDLDAFFKSTRQQFF